MPNYANGKIYKLIDGENQCLYVGSTVHSLERRLMCHKTACNYGIMMPLYRYIRSLPNGWENIKIQLVCDAVCESLEHLRRIEGGYIRNIKPKCNRVIAGRTSVQYYQDNRIRIKQFYQDNKTRLIEYQKQYNHEHADHIREYMRTYVRPITEI